METTLQKAENFDEKRTKIRLLTVWAANRIMKKYLNIKAAYSVSDPYRMAVENHLSH